MDLKMLAADTFNKDNINLEMHALEYFSGNEQTDSNKRESEEGSKYYRNILHNNYYFRL